MKQKTIKLSIYYSKVTIILDDEDLSFTSKKYKTGCLRKYGAVTLRNEKFYRHYVVAFSDKEHLSNIAHEIVHLKNYIFMDCGIHLDINNDEAEAYLTGYLFDIIYKFLKT